MTLKEEMNKTGVTIVLGSYNRLPFLKLTVQSIREEIARCNFPCEIIISDGGSTDGTLQWLVSQKDIITVVQHNRGEWKGKPIKRRSWGYFMNLIYKLAQGKYICMVSDDCLIVPNAITNGFKVFEENLNQDKIGAVAFYWRNWPEMKEYWVGLTFGEKIFVNHGLYLRTALEEIGFIDEDTYMFYHADGDLCLKLWEKGYKVIISPESYIEHYSHANAKIRLTNNDKQQKDWDSYIKRWTGIFDTTSPGSWITKKFIDPEKVAKRFLKLHVIQKIKNSNKKMIIKNILKKLVKQK